MSDKKIVYSAIQSSGSLTIGNYFGALKNWVEMQDHYECFYSVADLHAITVKQDPAAFHERNLEVMSILLACGIDPEKSTLFFQSHVPTHSQLTWVLNCYTMFGELSRMTQFKDKSARHANNVNVGLYDYPVLMASDILLYKADFVPVGEDQKQHLELSRDIAQRFNAQFPDTFTVPEPYITKTGARIMSLADPTKKMSKSDPNPNGYIFILDDEKTILKKFKKAVTDSESVVRYAPGKDGINNLMSIYSAATGKSFEQIEKEFDGKGYGAFKTAVGQAVVMALAPVRERYEALRGDSALLEKIYTKGALHALEVSNKVMDDVYEKLGYVKKGF